MSTVLDSNFKIVISTVTSSNFVQSCWKNLGFDSFGVTLYQFSITITKIIIKNFTRHRYLPDTNNRIHPGIHNGHKP